MIARTLTASLLFLVPSAFAVPIPGMASLGSDYVVGEGIHRDGVTVFPVLDPGGPKLPDGETIVPFAQALQQGVLTVTENGHSMQVASLRVHNRGKDPVLVMAGEVVEGGSQDRIITQDVLIPPSDAPMVVQVNCVERGRWGGGHQFAYGGRAELGLRRVVQVRRNQDATWEAVRSVNSGKAALLAQLGYDARSMAPSTGTYMASMRESALERQVAKLTEEIAVELEKEGDVVGIVVAVNGRVVGSEVYGYPEVFDQVREETIAAVARDAMTQQTYGAWTAAPDASVAAAFLGSALGGREVASTTSGVAVHRTVEGDDTMSYVLADADGDLLHITSYALD